MRRLYFGRELSTTFSSHSFLLVEDLYKDNNALSIIIISCPINFNIIFGRGSQRRRFILITPFLPFWIKC